MNGGATNEELLALKAKANILRQHIIRMLANAGSGHPGGALGMADIFSALYFRVLKLDPKRPNLPERDRLFLSNGHICPVQYAAMAERGFFPLAELATLRKLHSRLQGHPERHFLPGIENTSGPLGDGAAQSVGSAFIGMKTGADYTVYTVLSDGELASGIVWESALFAGKYQLSNLIWIIDRNRIQIGGDTEEIMPLEPLHEKFTAFNFLVLEIDGHNMRDIVGTLEEAKKAKQPVVIIAHTVPGKGVEFMENDYRWHGSPPNAKEAEEALASLLRLKVR